MMPYSFDREQLVVEARSVLSDNDRGSYTVPSHGLYPFQWNWDSCLTALGLQTIDRNRAWVELETLIAHQWADGMIPHIVFHTEDDGYFPGPGVWRTDRATATAGTTPTSGITQPPVLGLVLESLWRRSARSEADRQRCLALVGAAERWHEWFHRTRDPQGTGLVAIIHPWESGRDNSADWDQAMAAVSTDSVGHYERRDTGHVSADQRPTRADYDRYVALLQRFADLDWDQRLLHDASPFQMVDPGFNAILIAADHSLARLAEPLGCPELGKRAEARAARGEAALAALWNPELGQYDCWNRLTTSRAHNPSVAGLLPVLALRAEHPHRRRLCRRIERSLEAGPFGVASQDPSSASFDPTRYWRGPSWLVVNYLLARGLAQHGSQQLAERVVTVGLNALETGGFAEYYDPRTGAPLGGSTFSWTAAMAIEFLRADDE